MLTALGARGLTLAPLLGRLVAAQATGTPWPLEQDLADAVDPGRWIVRAARAGSRQASAVAPIVSAGLTRLLPERPRRGIVLSSGSSATGGSPAALRAAFSRSFSSFFFFLASSRWRFSNE